MRYFCRVQKGNKAKRRKKAMKRRDVGVQRAETSIHFPLHTVTGSTTILPFPISFLLTKSNHFHVMMQSLIFHYFSPVFHRRLETLNELQIPAGTATVSHRSRQLCFDVSDDPLDAWWHVSSSATWWQVSSSACLCWISYGQCARWPSYVDFCGYLCFLLLEEEAEEDETVWVGQRLWCFFTSTQS